MVGRIRAIVSALYPLAAEVTGLGGSRACSSAAAIPSSLLSLSLSRPLLAATAPRSLPSLAPLGSSFYGRLDISQRRCFIPQNKNNRRFGRQQRQAPPRMPQRNQEIKAPELRLVFPEDEKRTPEVMSLEEALKHAEERKLDLVMASPNAVPPVARLVEWDKVIYAQRQKEKAADRAQRESRRLSVPKEVRVGCSIAPHDLAFKLEAAKRFLGEGHYLRLVVTFRGGREIQPARATLERIMEEMGPLATVRDPRQLQRPQMNQWVVQLAPLVKDGE